MKKLPGPFGWLLAIQLGMVAKEHWELLEDKERRRLLLLARKSKALPGNLSKRERDELKELLVKLDLLAAGRKAVGVRMARRKL